MSAALALLTQEQLAELLEQAAERGAAKALALKGAPAELVSSAEMCRRLGVSRSTLHRLRKEGAPAVRVGDVFRYRADRVIEWFEARKEST